MTSRPGWAKHLNPVLAELSPYTPAAGDYPVRLDANEAPDLLSPAARHRLNEATAHIDWRRYPDAGADALRQALAEHSGVAANETLVGVGSDELISMLLRTFAGSSKQPPLVLTLTPSFVMYKMTARIHGHRVLELPLDEAWDLDLDAVQKALEFAEPSLIFIASPNNPTGTMVSPDRLRALVERAEGSLVVIDEAYVDYADNNQLALFREHANVMLLRTLSKVGFAALRVGWLIARPEIVEEVNKTRLPYNTPVPSQQLALLAVTELGQELERIRQTVRDERERVTRLLGQRPGIEPTQSQANFIWFKTSEPAEHVYQSLKRQGVLVRSFHKSGGRLKHYLRVTLGLAAENDRFLAALGALS